MSTRPRALLAGLAALSLLLAACGDDDDSASDETTTTEGSAGDDGTDEATDEATDDATDEGTGSDDEELDVCALLDLETASSLTNESFTTAEQTEADTCQVSNDDQTALLQLSVRLLAEGQTEESFVADGATACDAGTELEVDTSYAAAGVACEITGEAALLVAEDGAGALLIGHPSDPAVTTEMVIGALNQIMEDVVSG